MSAAGWSKISSLDPGLGVALASAYAALLPSAIALLVGMTVAALIRFPAQQRHGALESPPWLPLSSWSCSSSLT